MQSLLNEAQRRSKSNRDGTSSQVYPRHRSSRLDASRRPIAGSGHGRLPMLLGIDLLSHGIGWLTFAWRPVTATA